MAVVAWQLGRAAIVDWRTLTILIASSIVVLRFRVNPAFVIAGAGMIGWLLLKS
jgi:chromate transporter